MFRSVMRNIKVLNLKLDSILGQQLRKYDLTPQQMSILMFILKNDGVCQKQIEKNFDLTSPTVTGIISRLEKKGFLVRVPMDDRRFNRIIVTTKTTKIKEKMDGVLAEMDVILEKGVTREEVLLLNKILEKIMSNLEVCKND